MHLASNLKTLRTLNKLSRKQLAKEIGISYSALSKYELGERKPDLDLLLKFSKFFNVSVDFLLGNESFALAENFMKDEESGYDGANHKGEGYLKGIKLEYLELAIEMQEAKLDPKSIKKIIEALKIEKDR